MKFIIAYILTIASTSIVVGQEHSASLVDSLCNITLQYHFGNSEKSQKRATKANYIILKADLTTNLKTDFTQFQVSYLTKQEALEKISKTKNKTGSIDKIEVKQYSDTIDILIAGWSVSVAHVEFIKGRPTNIHSNWIAGCGGTLGYIPTCRFVYSNNTGTWTKYTDAEITAYKANQRLVNKE